MRKSLLATLLLSLPALADYNLVYTKQPRVAEDFANWQHWMDGGQPDRFTEADLVIDDLHGTITTIHDCTTQPAICAAHDGRVSPDGTRIAYTLAEGAGLYPVKTWGDNRLTPAMEFRATRFSVWLYDIVTKSSVKLDANARMPDWLSNDTLVFASGRLKTYVPWAHAGMEEGYKAPALQLYRAPLTGTTLGTKTLLTAPGTYALNPSVTSSGEICYSEWNGFGQRGVDHTPANMWWLRCMNSDGTNNHVVLGAHGSPTLKARAYLPTVDPARSGEGTFQFKVLRPVTEIRKGLLATTSYYRNNHIGGGGILYGFPISAAEGCLTSDKVTESEYKSSVPGSGRYVPCDGIVLTPFANDQDLTNSGTRYDKAGRAMGKAVTPAPSPDGRYIFTHQRGSCYEGTMPDYNTRLAMGGEPTCKAEIRKALVDRITDPFDTAQSVVIACADESYSCRDARYIAPYEAIMHTPLPSPLPVLAGNMTRLHIVNARMGELWPIPGGSEQDKVSFQGNAIIDWHKYLTAIQIERVYPWEVMPPVGGFTKTEILGKYAPETDGSLAITIPCGIVYQVSGVNEQGVKIATDNTLHYAVCGETITCHGCHDGHSEQRIQALGKSATERWKTTIAGQKPGGC